MSPASPLLETSSLLMRFGGVTAVDHVDLNVQEGSITALIGPNGAGKTTLFNLVCGVLPPTAGRVRLAGTDITGWRTHEICQLGIARTFQNLELFEGMTVEDHFLVGQHRLLHGGTVDALCRLPRHHRDEATARERAERLLAELGLTHLRDREADALPYGLQRRVELGRALASQPRLLLLDEPTAGLNAAEAADIADLIRAQVATGLTVLLVEHDMATVMGLSDRVLVLDHGRLIADGSPDQVRADPDVIRAYLGDEEW